VRLHPATLSQEGITGEFALESDYTPATFGQGTLAGTVATSTTAHLPTRPTLPRLQSHQILATWN
jgi:hypothetical protein